MFIVILWFTLQKNTNNYNNFSCRWKQWNLSKLNFLGTSFCVLWQGFFRLIQIKLTEYLHWDFISNSAFAFEIDKVSSFSLQIKLTKSSYIGILPQVLLFAFEIDKVSFSLQIKLTKSCYIGIWFKVLYTGSILFSDWFS